MERLRAGSPVYTRQKSISSSTGVPSSPTTMSPAHPLHHHQNRHLRSGSAGARQGPSASLNLQAARFKEALPGCFERALGFKPGF
ncbi:hypothetical protein BHM03_00059885 [Ensete ventricosum]|nr:hypothetical protein BHM03_00059885 [Ensete ventricosum]